MHLATDPWVWVGVFFTFAVFSFLYKDNPFFKLAEHVVVGISVGYGMVFWATQAFYQKFWIPFTQEHKYIYIIPAILGLMIVLRLFPKLSWLSRYPFAFVMGAGSGIGLPLAMQAGILKQFQATMLPLNFTTWQGICDIIILIGVFATLIYFFYSKEHKGAIGAVANLGIWFLMVGFGATFGYTVMARLSLFIGRMLFIFKDALGIQNIGGV
jgi:hypothetical protein